MDIIRYLRAIAIVIVALVDVGVPVGQHQVQLLLVRFRPLRQVLVHPLQEQLQLEVGGEGVAAVVAAGQVDGSLVEGQVSASHHGRVEVELAHLLVAREQRQTHVAAHQHLLPAQSPVYLTMRLAAVAGLARGLAEDPPGVPGRLSGVGQHADGQIWTAAGVQQRGAELRDGTHAHVVHSQRVLHQRFSA
eukprot:CAMPEP_0201113272 /NCGR_PEP_ID=MMETSP0812-20130820/77752_1 /ASSEMBLY_ACC=CAM_ASM_000668 /TAXON_ID=98059 /ORGANISM="Dinobryon sp., Strain UTEXLB2267" /LENGTH=189 /DNA_ID=CAMNT_0047376783 /DNA_START=85 /DNA_END=655 /DNA_ORIENTATION=+